MRYNYEGEIKEGLLMQTHRLYWL